MKDERVIQMHSHKGFIAALDQSGGSTPKALRLYGVDASQYHSDEEMFNSIIKEIKDLGYDASLEVICGSCALEAKEEAEFFDLPLTSEDDIYEEGTYHLFCFKAKSDKDYHQAITDIESFDDYQAVLAFLKGDAYFKDCYDRYHSIMDEQDTIKRMTGIGIKENDSNEE